MTPLAFDTAFLGLHVVMLWFGGDCCFALCFIVCECLCSQAWKQTVAFYPLPQEAWKKARRMSHILGHSESENTDDGKIIYKLYQKGEWRSIVLEPE